METQEETEKDFVAAAEQASAAAGPRGIACISTKAAPDTPAAPKPAAAPGYRAMDAPSQTIASALAEGGPEEREAAYAAIEDTVRAAPPSGGGREQAIALAVACVKPLIMSVLCAPASRVAVAEWRRAAVLLCVLRQTRPSA
jgi:hypothetical protein